MHRGKMHASNAEDQQRMFSESDQGLENLTNGVLVNHSKQSLVLELMDIHILFYNLYNHFVNMLNISIMHVSDKWTE